MGNEPSKRSMSKTGAHDTSINNDQNVNKIPRDQFPEVSSDNGDSSDLGKIDILRTDSTKTSPTAKTLLEVANSQHVTDNVSSITVGESVDNTVHGFKDNTVSINVQNDSVLESSTDSPREATAPPGGNVYSQIDTPPTTPRKDTPTTPGRDDSGVESSSDIVQVGRSSGGSRNSGTKSKVSKKSKKLEESKKLNKSTSQINMNESIEDEVVSSKKDKKKKLKKKISKQNSTVSDVGMTSTVSMSSGLNVSSVSSDAGRGTLERSVSSVEPGFGVVNSKENKKPRRPLSKSFSDIEQQKEKKKKKKVDKKKSSIVSAMQVPVENTNKEKRRSIFEEDFTVELGLAEENLDVVSLSSLSSDDDNVDLENGPQEEKHETTDQHNENEEIVKSTYRSTSESNITLKDSTIDENETGDDVYNHIVYKRKITVLKHEPVLLEKNSIETSEQNNNLETKPKLDICDEVMKNLETEPKNVISAEAMKNIETEPKNVISDEAMTNLETEPNTIMSDGDVQNRETESKMIMSDEDDKNLEKEPNTVINDHDEGIKSDALKQLSIDYSSEGEEVDETFDDVLGNYSLVDQIVAHVSREYCCAPQEILTDRNKNGVRRIGHSQSMSPTEGGKLHRPVRRQYSEDVTRTRFANSLRPDGSEGDFHDPPRRVILTRPLSFDYPSTSFSPSPSSKPSKKRQNSFSEMLKKSTTAFTHHHRKNRKPKVSH